MSIDKRVFDVVGAAGGLLFFSPVMVAISMAVWVEDGGPVLFRQTRVGARGETFNMLKFRSMGVDAEERLAQLAENADAGNTVLFKMRHDPRITRIGGFLRRYSVGHGWTSLAKKISPTYGQMTVWPGDTFGLSSSKGAALLSWGSAVKPSTISEIYFSRATG